MNGIICGGCLDAMKDMNDGTVSGTEPAKNMCRERVQEMHA